MEIFDVVVTMVAVCGNDDNVTTIVLPITVHTFEASLAVISMLFIVSITVQENSIGSSIIPTMDVFIKSLITAR